MTKINYDFQFKTTRKFILILLGSLFSISAKSQLSLGLNTGYTHNEFYTNIGQYFNNYYKKEGSYIVSAPLQFAINDWFALQAEPGLIQKSFSLGQTLQTTQPTKLTSRYNYVQLPVMAQFSFGGSKLRGFVSLGGYVSYWLSGKIKGSLADTYNQADYQVPVYSIQEVDGKYEFNSTRDRRLQFGWLAGGGLTYKLNTKLTVLSEYRYYGDLTDQQKNYMLNQIPKYNITTAITVGCLYNFR